MLSILVKKQLKEIFRAYYINRKSGKGRSKAGIAGMFMLFVVIMLFLSTIFIFVAQSLCGPLASVGLNWLYFSIMGVITISLGVVGSVFNSYEAMFHAKDNETLLSMPIKPMHILLSRMLSVYVLALIYGGIAWLSGVFVYFAGFPKDIKVAILGIIAWPVITLFVTVLTCLLGWLVAIVSRKIKHKNIVVTVLSLVVFGAYYYFCGNLSNIVTGIMANSEEIGSKFSKYGNIFYLLGKGVAGSVFSYLLFIAITAVSFAILMYLMSKTFKKIATKGNNAQETVKEIKKETKQLSLNAALFRRELRRFTSSPTYMLNGGLGIVAGPIIAIVGIVKMETIRGIISGFETQVPTMFRMIPFIILAAVCFTFGLNMISTPSISLEGKSLWLVKSLPISGRDFLDAKEKLHVKLNIYPAVFTLVIIALVAELEPPVILLMLAYTAVFIRFNGVLGLLIGIKNPNFEWTNETVPIKQSVNLFIQMVISWFVIGLTVLLGYLIKADWSQYVVVGAVAVAIAIGEAYIRRWLYLNADRLLKAL